MDRRVCLSLKQPRHFLTPFRVAVFLLLLCNPVYADGISLSFDSEGRTLTSISRPGENSTRMTAHRTTSEGAELLRNTAYEFYPVSGRTFSEIVRSVGENGPYNKGRTMRQPCRVDWSATLSFQYDFSYALDEEDGKLHAATEVSGVTLEDSSTVTLPSLIDDTALNPVEQSMWKTYFAGVAEHCHNIVAIIRAQQVRKNAYDKLAEITYLIFDYSEGMDVEKSVELFLRDEALRIGRESVREISSRIADYDRASASAGRQKKEDRQKEF
jgi:predicted secreted Zn-dependent protease